MLCPEPKQTLKYNHIKRIEIKSEKDITFLFKGNTASSRVKKVQKVQLISILMSLKNLVKQSSFTDELNYDKILNCWLCSMVLICFKQSGKVSL